MAISGSRCFVGRRLSGRVPLACILAVVACPVDRRASADDLRCGADADCVLTNFDCSECGPCPDTPPLAITPRALKHVEEECKKHPPARLARRPGDARGPMPACSPCPSSLLRTAAPIYRAACVENRCQAVVDFYQVTPPSEAPLRGQAAPATASRDARTCSNADDCTLTNFECTACGRCPGSPPVALNGQALVDLQAKCRKHPPARLDPKPKQGAPRPKCAKCPPLEPKRPIPWFRVDCVEGQCQVVSEPARKPEGSED
ncbi:MAG TPA: hypothetical protein VJ801_17455 [Polyangia bacterium]|nr:hypothetical protein [Polyangia bacterium]